MIIIRNVHLSDVVQIYKDPETETELEGYAFVWEITAQDDEYYTLLVSFRGDPRDRKVPRRLRKIKAKQERAYH